MLRTLLRKIFTTNVVSKRTDSFAGRLGSIMADSSGVPHNPNEITAGYQKTSLSYVESTRTNTIRYLGPPEPAPVSKIRFDGGPTPAPGVN